MLEPCLPRVLNTGSEAFEVWDDTDLDDKECTTNLVLDTIFLIN